MAIAKTLQSPAQHIIDRVSKVETTETTGTQRFEVSSAVTRLMMTALQNGETSGLQGCSVSRHRTAMQQHALTMHLNRPLRVGAEEQGILDQSDGSSRQQRRVVSEELMGIDQSEIHAQPSPARRQARRPMDRA